MRRNVFRVMLTYAIAGWLLVEGMDLLTDVFEAPSWVIKVFIGVVVLGILPVLIFSWVYEITPDGIKKEAAGDPEHSRGDSRKLDIAVLVMLTIAIGVFVEGRLSRDNPTPSVQTEETVAENKGPPMVAVLPFVSVSLGGDSEFFAIGVHDDLLTQLAQLHSIRVISRTSVLEYRDAVRNIREIGKALGADAILEGGVQSVGNRIRINAQLIDAKTDEHLWAETYDRELTPSSIFDVQTEIARAITTALKVTLTDQDSSQLAAIPTENMGAYRAFHRAMEIRSADGNLAPEYKESLEEAVALDPTFTRAWAELAGKISYENFGIDRNTESIERVEQILEKIRMLAPNSADDFVGQAYYTYYILKDYDRAYQFIVQAQELRPSDPRIVELKSWIERRQGNFEGRLDSIRLARSLDPRNPGWTINLINNLIVTHHYDEAMQEIEESALDEYTPLYWRNMLLLREHGNMDRWAKGLAALQEEYAGDVSPMELWDGHISRRDYAAAESILSDLKGRSETEAAHRYNFAYRDIAEIITYWAQEKAKRLAETLIGGRSFIESGRKADGDFVTFNSLLDMALVNAAEGNTQETERLLRRWERDARSDLAEFSMQWNAVCQLLGMAGAAEGAAQCIREGLEMPSLVIPFFEPHLPYYDSIRAEPAFVELLEELGVDAES